MEFPNAMNSLFSLPQLRSSRWATTEVAEGFFTRSIEMITHGFGKQSRRLVVWAALGVLAFVAANSPWFTAVALACQNHGGGC